MLRHALSTPTSQPRPPHRCFTASIKAPVLQRRCVDCRASSNASASSSAQTYVPKSAKDAVESGTAALKDRKSVDEAIRLYKAALDLNPNMDEARAAHYNLGCAYAKQKKWKEASDNVVKAVNEYRLKLIVALKDDDLAELRDTREWIEALTVMKGGLTRQAKLDLRTEAKAPFRLPRMILFGALFLGAGLGLFIILLRLVKALQGGPDAPDLTESLQNLGINSVAVVVLGALLYRDFNSKQQAMKVTDREESLSRLQIALGNNRVLPLIKFRGSIRPVIIAGTKAFVERAIKEAEPFQAALRKRGVSLVPIVSDGDLNINAPAGKKVKELDPSERILALKRELNQKKDSSAKGFDSRAPAPVPVKVETASEEDKKWLLEAHDSNEWASWMLEQKEFANQATDRLNCYIQVQLDGTVRGSGTGIPPWAKFLDDLPEMDSIRTLFTDNIGPSI